MESPYSAHKHKDDADVLSYKVINGTQHYQPNKNTNAWKNFVFHFLLHLLRKAFGHFDSLNLTSNIKL